LLAQANIIGWGHSWPFYLILAGVLALAERAALATDGDYPPAPYPGTYPPPGGPYPGAPYQAAPAPAAPVPQAPAEPSTAIVPANHDYEIERNGGQS